MCFLGSNRDPSHHSSGVLTVVVVDLDEKNLKDGSLFLETYYKPPPSSSRDQDDLGALPSTLPEAFSTTMVASGVMCE
jgi:hypothetical protein